MSVNADKSRSLTLAAAAGRKLVRLDAGYRYRAGDEMIGAMSMDDSFEYLGVLFGCSGIVHDRIDLDESLERITRAPLKPQQRLELLRTRIADVGETTAIYISNIVT